MAYRQGDGRSRERGGGDDDDDEDGSPLLPSSGDRRKKKAPAGGVVGGASRTMLGYRAAVALATATVAVVLLLAGGGGGGSGASGLGQTGRLAGGGPAAGQETLPTRQALQSLASMRTKFKEAKATLLDEIAEKYGPDTADKMFLLSSSANATMTRSSAKAAMTRGRLLYGSDEAGWRGLKRKLSIKLLQALDGNQKNTAPTFVWVTSGNSVAAGHGNFLNQSYTAVLESAVKPLFDALHMKFVGRNYGMSAAHSGPGIALCLEAIIGTDVDLLAWDFSLTDARSYELSELFYHRSAMVRSRPVALAMPRGASSDLQSDVQQKALATVRSASALGLPALAMDERQLVEAFRHVPDTWGMGQSEIDALPVNVRNFKCQGSLELGDPFCTESRFTKDETCTGRPWRVKWHPGWKWSAVQGYAMALFLMEALEETMEDLVSAFGCRNDNDVSATSSTNSTPPTSPRLLEERLVAEEEADYRRVVEEPSLPEYSVRYHKNESSLSLASAGYLRALYYRRQNYCRTAALPAESRYRGVLTDQLDDPPSRSSFDAVGPHCATSPAHAGRLPFDNGTDGAVRLVCDSKYRQVCDDPISVDHRDYFYVGYGETGALGGEDEGEEGGGAWRQLTLPTDAERAYYGPPAFGRNDDEKAAATIDLDGVIAFCSSDCGGQSCIPADVHFHGDLAANLGTAVEMRVNGENVAGLATLTNAGALFSHCHVLLRNADNGGVRWDPDPSGRYKVEVRVLREGHYVRFSSFLLW